MFMLRKLQNIAQERLFWAFLGRFWQGALPEKSVSKKKLNLLSFALW